MSPTPSLSVVIVGYNVASLLRQCLASVGREIAGLNAEVFVVDNASKDGTPTMIRTHFPWVQLMASEVNMWFAGGNNVALPRCQGQFILLLNPDTLVHEGALKVMIDYLGTHPTVGAVGPTIRLAGGSVQPECARNLPALGNLFPWLLQLDKTAWAVRRRCLPAPLRTQRGHPPRWNLFDRLNLLSWERDCSCEVECLSGACMLIRNEVVRRVGLMDESCKLYFDDIDYCQRIRNSGFVLHLVKEATITHFWRQSTSQLGCEEDLYGLVCHSQWVFLRKHKGVNHARAFSAMALAAAPVRMAVCLAAVMVSRREGRRFWRRQLSMAKGLSRWAFSVRKTAPGVAARAGAGSTGVPDD